MSTGNVAKLQIRLGRKRLNLSRRVVQKTKECFMKADRHTLLTTVTMALIYATLSSAHAADLTDKLVAACKESVAAKYAHPYMRFKGISGRPSSRKVKLLVLPKKESPYRANCFIHSITQVVLSIARAS
jgi:hypothetical protein